MKYIPATCEFSKRLRKRSYAVGLATSIDKGPQRYGGSFQHACISYTVKQVNKSKDRLA